FVGRRVDGDPAPGEGAPPYRNLSGTRPTLGYAHVAGKPEAITCEGPLDWLTALAWCTPAWCTCGANFPLDRLGHLASAATIFGVLDADEAGRSAAGRYRAVFGDIWRPLALPEGLDLNALACQRGGRARFEAILAAARRARDRPSRAARRWPPGKAREW